MFGKRGAINARAGIYAWTIRIDSHGGLGHKREGWEGWESARQDRTGQERGRGKGKPTVDVVVAGDAGDDGEVARVGERHFLGVELLEAVRILRFGWPGI